MSSISCWCGLLVIQKIIYRSSLAIATNPASRIWVRAESDLVREYVSAWKHQVCGENRRPDRHAGA